MPKEYTKEQLWKLYEKLPEELREAIFSENTANNIGAICQRNEIEDKRVSEIASYIGRVLLGILPPDEFKEILKKELKLKNEQLKRVIHEINRFIFFPVKANLAKLYEVEIVPTVKTKIEKKPEVLAKEKPKKTDVYREPIE